MPAYDYAVANPAAAFSPVQPGPLAGQRDDWAGTCFCQLVSGDRPRARLLTALNGSQ